jgi:transcription elongation factor Elf1
MICLDRTTGPVTCPHCGEHQVGAEIVVESDQEYWVCAACGDCHELA